MATEERQRNGGNRAWIASAAGIGVNINQQTQVYFTYLSEFDHRITAIGAISYYRLWAKKDWLYHVFVIHKPIFKIISLFSG